MRSSGQRGLTRLLCLPLCIMAMCVTGCLYVLGEPFDGYGYSGTILYGDGTPARGIRAFASSRKFAAAEVGQQLRLYVPVTDDQGVFKGSFHTLGRILREAPPLNEVYVYIEQPTGYSEMRFDLDPATQTKVGTYSREVPLPLVRMPR